jgi:hypothetical protein
LVPKRAAIEPGARGFAEKLAPFRIPLAAIAGGAVVVIAAKRPWL